jgi:predicted DNA-binding protein with PD1-like motif
MSYEQVVIRLMHAEDAIEKLQAWLDEHRVGNTGFDCVQAVDVAAILTHHATSSTGGES